MSKKNAVFNIIVLLIITSVCLSFSPIKTNNENREHQMDLNEFISYTPKSSSYEVSKRWNCTTDFEVLSVAVSADGNYMVAGIDYTGSSGHAIFFFNTSVHDGIPMWIYNTTNSINSIAISKDGEYIVASSIMEQKAYLLNKTVPEAGKSKQEVWYVSYINDIIYSIDISEDGQFIVIGGFAPGGGFIYVYNNSYASTGLDKTSEKLWSYLTNLQVNSVKISANGMYVAAGTVFDSDKDEVYFFNNTDYIYNQEHKPEWTFDTDYAINSIAISKDGFYFVAAGYEDRAFLFNRTMPEAGKNKQYIWLVNWGGSDYDIYSVDISEENGKFIAIGGGIKPYSIGHIRLYNNSYPISSDKTDEYLWDYTLDENYRTINSVAITDYGEYIAAGTDKYLQKDTIFLFNNTDYTCKQEHKPEWSFNTSYNINSVSISSWGNYIGAGGNYSLNRGMIYLFYHARPLPIVPLPFLLSDDDDDGNDEEPPINVPFGNHYLIFTVIGIVSLAIILKRKINLSKK